MNENAINDPRYSQYSQQEERKGNEKSPFSFIENRIGKKIGKKISQQITQQIFKTVIKQGVTTSARAAASNPWGITVIIIIILLLILLYMFFPGSDSGKALAPEEETPIGGGIAEPEVTGLTVSKIGDSQVEFGQNITYSITVNYDESAGGTPIEKIVVVDKLPANVEFVSATGTYVQTGSTIEWPLKTGTSNYNFTLIVKPTLDNIEVSNTVFGRSLVASSKLLDSSASNLNAIFNDAASMANVPVALLKAIAKTESGVLGYSSDEVTQFSTILWWQGLLDNAPNLSDNHPLIKRGYAYNTCQYVTCAPGADVRGAMQFELGTWNGIAPLLSFTDGHSPDRRYIRDIIYAAGYFIRGKIDQYDSRFNFTNNLSSLNETQVKALAKSYCGGDPDADTNDPACGFGRHEQSVWAYYQEYNNN